MATANERIKELEERLHKSEFRNLMMRIEIEQLTEFPNSEVSKKIIHKYKIKRAIRDESELSTKN